MTTISYLRSHYILVKANIAMNLLFTPIIYFFHIFPFVFVCHSKKMALYVFGKLVYVNNYSESSHKIILF